MNRRQKIAIVIGVVVVALMMLVPPWRRQSSGYRSSRPGGLYSSPALVASGYGLLFYPPPGVSSVDTSRLTVQCGLVAVLTFGVFVMLGHKKD